VLNGLEPILAHCTFVKACTDRKTRREVCRNCDGYDMK